MILHVLARSAIHRFGVPRWQATLIVAAVVGVCLVGSWILYRLLPPRLHSRVAIGMMVLGGLMLMSCLIRAYDFIEGSPAVDVIFIGLLIGAPLVGGMGVFLHRRVTGTD